MKAAFLLSLFTLLAMVSVAQAPNWDWVRNAGFSSSTLGLQAIASDAAGNVVIGGSYQTLTIDSFQLPALPPAAGHDDMFLASFDATGTFKWAIREGSSIWNWIAALTITPSGDICATIFFTGTTTISGHTFVAADWSDILTVVYDSNGVFKWATQAGGHHIFPTLQVAHDDSGNIYVPGAIENFIIQHGDTVSWHDAEVLSIKYGSHGDLKWVRSTGSAADEIEPTGIAADRFSNTYQTGFYRGKTFFDNFLLPGDGTYARAFFMKRNADGSLAWAKTMKGLSTGHEAAAGRHDGIYFLGSVKDSAVINGDTLVSSDVEGYHFLMKMDTAGGQLWIRTFECPNYCFMDSDDSGYVYVSGYNGPNIARFDPDGTLSWMKSVGTDGHRRSLMMLVNADGPDPVVASRYAKISLACDVFTIPPSGSNNIFLGKLHRSPFPAVADSIVNEEPFIYPNPSDGEFTVVADPLAFNAYLVIDLAGRTMLSGNITSAKTRISLGGSQGGLYQLVLKGKSGSLSKNLLLAY